MSGWSGLLAFVAFLVLVCAISACRTWQLRDDKQSDRDIAEHDAWMRAIREAQ